MSYLQSDMQFDDIDHCLLISAPALLFCKYLWPWGTEYENGILKEDLTGWVHHQSKLHPYCGFSDPALEEMKLMPAYMGVLLFDKLYRKEQAQQCAPNT